MRYAFQSGENLLHVRDFGFESSVTLAQVFLVLLQLQFTEAHVDWSGQEAGFRLAEETSSTSNGFIILSGCFLRFNQNILKEKNSY